MVRGLSRSGFLGLSGLPPGGVLGGCGGLGSGLEGRRGVTVGRVLVGLGSLSGGPGGSNNKEPV